jgi:hypothetical protein
MYTFRGKYKIVTTILYFPECTHFEDAKVMTLHLSLNISQCQLPCVTQNQNIFFYENRSRKDREREDTDFAQYSRNQE